MPVLPRINLLHTLAAATVFLGAAMLRPAAAEAQGRGIVQASAQVVDTKDSYAALHVAHSAAHIPSQSETQGRDVASTVARVSMTYAPQDRAGVVITIDYSKN